MIVPPDSSAAPRHRLLLLIALAGGIVLLALPVVLSDGRKLLAIVAQIRAPLLVLPVAFMIASYVAMSRSYQGIADAAQCRLPFRDWIRITFVSNTVNYLVTSAGLSGFAVRMYLLGQQGVPSGRAVLISLVQTFLTNFTLFFFILIGFATLVLGHRLPPAALAAAGGAVVVFTALLAWCIVLIYHRQLRRRTLFLLADAGHRILRRVVPRWTPRRVRLWRFQHNLNEGLEFLFARKDRIVAPAAWIFLDWFFMMGILWAAFHAVNCPVSPGLIVIGFAVGIALSLVPLVPGGLGIMDVSMTGVFVSFGVPLEHATLAVLIFRVAYYVLPLLTSLFLFHGLMRQATRSMASPTPAI
ncbi:MAG TPA: flippase-like domain-containing protein [Candidatus Binatia bacterium]|nr:flippase-like domain-containing protein [Candidatus Binatia bacterium]